MGKPANRKKEAAQAILSNAEIADRIARLA
jgi:hypothetical protein